MKIVKINHPKGQRPNIKLTVRRCEPSIWHSLGFSKEHYLTAELNKSCKCLLFEWNNVPVGFVGILNTPRKGIPYGCSVSRIVILPDYQGLGLSTMIFNFIGGIVKSLSDDEHDYREYDYGSTSILVPTAPDKTGYQFDGWLKKVGQDPYSTDVVDMSTEVVTADVTYKAKYSEIEDEYTITFVL